jgi:hypothetical protein
MPEFPSDYTDKLFQEGAKQYTFTYAPEAWDQMEVMLDNENKRRTLFSYVKYGLLGIALLGLLITGLSLFNGAPANQPEGEATSSTANAVNSSPSDATEIEKQTLQFTADNNTTLKTESSKLTVVPKQETSRVKYDLSAANQVFDEDQNTRLAPIVLEKPSPITEAHSASNSSVSNDLIPAGTLSTVNDLSFTTENPSKREEILSNELAVNKLNFIRLSSSISLKELIEDAPPAQPVSTAKAKSALLSRISLRAQGGVIYGYTSESGVGVPRTRYSLGADYALTEKFTLGTGLSINNLCYVTNGAGYPTKSADWFGGASPSRIQAQCRILEIPIEATYHFGNRRNSGVFVRGGLLSYIMLRETYNYSYEDSVIPPDVQTASLRLGWNEKNSNQHFMGIAQASIGYQFALSPTRQLQLEGFVHAPLTGIGHGNVKVWSFGLNTAINLNLK